MAGITGPLKVSQLTPLPMTGSKAPRLIERTALGHDFVMSEPPTEEETAAGLARQDAIKAHTVFTVGGKIVAVQRENGWSLFIQGGSVALEATLKDSGLTGEALNKHNAAEIEKALRKVYGGSLEVHSFAGDPAAPTMGQLTPALWHGKTLKDVLSGSAGSGTPTSLLSMSGQAFSILNSRSR